MFSFHCLIIHFPMNFNSQFLRMASPIKTFNIEVHEINRFHNWKILSKWVSPGSTKFSHSKSCLKNSKKKSISSMKWMRDQDEYSSNHLFRTIIFFVFLYLVIFGTDAYVDYTHNNGHIFLIVVFLSSIGVAIAYIIHTGLQYYLWAEWTRVLTISSKSIEMMNGLKGLFGIVFKILWGMKPLYVTSNQQQKVNKTSINPKSHKVSQNERQKKSRSKKKRNAQLSLKQKQYYKENSESLLEKNKRYYKENSESLIEKKKRYYKRYYKENSESLLEKKKRYYKENNESLLEKKKQYYKENNESLLEKKKRYYKENNESLL